VQSVVYASDLRRRKFSPRSLRCLHSQHVADLVEGCGQAVLICEIVELWGGGRISARAPTLLVRAAEVIE